MLELTLDTAYPIPTLPVARAHTLALLMQPSVSLGEIASVAESDPALSVVLLRAANSVASAPVDPIRHVADAIVRLGIDDTRGIIVGTLVQDATSAALARAGLDLDELWRHVIAAALLTEAACATDPARAAVRPFAFTAGLLHDIGRLVLAARHPRRYERVVRLSQQGMDTRLAEVRQFGVDHAAFGGGVARAWGLPQTVTLAIVAHHEGGEPLADALRQALALVIALGIGDGVIPPLPAALELGAPEAAPVRLTGGPAMLVRRIEWFRGALGN